LFLNSSFQKITFVGLGISCHNQHLYIEEEQTKQWPKRQRGKIHVILLAIDCMQTIKKNCDLKTSPTNFCYHHYQIICWTN